MRIRALSIARYAITAVLVSLSSSSTFAVNVGWFYALDADKAAFEKVVGSPVRVVSLSGGTQLAEYQVANHKVYACRMGSGCVATAVSVSRVAAYRSLDRVISTGPAGAIGETAKPGQWSRIKRVIAWQKSSSQEWVIVPAGTDQADWPEGRWLGFPKADLVSGEKFVASAEQRGELSRTHSADMVEMNSFGLMGALEGMRCKVLILRVASDRADESAADDFNGFTKSYDGEGGRIVAEIVKSLPLEKNDPAAHESLKNLLDDAGQ
jgi:nucleoside phosphorylase